MNPRVAIAVVLFFVSLTGTVDRAMARDDEPTLMSKIGRETDSVKKAKLEVKLGRVRLQSAFDAYAGGKYEDCWKLLGSYQDAMNQAWTDLQTSGKIAAKKPDGFKQLDIGLRESRRDLENFETHITFAEREVVQTVRAKTEALHNQVLKALFPSVPLKKNKSNAPGQPPKPEEKGDTP